MNEIAVISRLFVHNKCTTVRDSGLFIQMILETSIEISATPEQVWSVLTDFERYPAWNPFIREIHGKLATGSRLVVELGPPEGRVMTFNPVVTRVETNQAFSWLGTLGGRWLFSGEHTFELESLPSGDTRFHHREVFGGVLLPLLKRSLDSDTRRGFEHMNAALKKVVETGQAQAPSVG